MTVDRQADALRHRGGTVAARPPMVAVLGAKGGVGKTTLAVNLAWLLARSGQRVLLVDLDPGCGDVGVHLRLSPRHSLDDVLQGRCAPTEALATAAPNLRVLATGHGEDALASGAPATLVAAFAAIETAAQGCDVVVCDTGAGIGTLALAAAERAELPLAVTTADPAAITDTYALYKVLQRRGRPLPHLVLNGVRSRDEAMRAAGRIATVCQRFLGAGAPLLAWLRRDPAYERSVCEQRPLAAGDDAAALEDLRALHAAVRSLLPTLPRRPAPVARTLVLRPSSGSPSAPAGSP